MKWIIEFYDHTEKWQSIFEGPFQTVEEAIRYLNTEIVPHSGLTWRIVSTELDASKVNK